jgi:hypothetical protein
MTKEAYLDHFIISMAKLVNKVIEYIDFQLEKEGIQLEKEKNLLNSEILDEEF